MNAQALLNQAPSELQVAGLTRLSTCDWPTELVATIFCQGCAWNCSYCHNPGLRPAKGESQIAWNDVVAFLESRRGLLDGVVFSGGEPTLQSALLNAIQTVRGFGFRIGLHTAGMTPERFAPLLPWVDWVGFDAKAPFGDYSRITGADKSGAQALASLRLLLASNIAYEVRTTFHPALLSLADMLALEDQLLTLGVTHYVVQRYRSAGARTNCLPALPDQQALDLPSNYGASFRQFRTR